MSTEGSSADLPAVERSDDGRWYVDDGVGVEFFDDPADARAHAALTRYMDDRRRELHAAKAEIVRLKDENQRLQKRVGSLLAEIARWSL